MKLSVLTLLALCSLLSCQLDNEELSQENLQIENLEFDISENEKTISESRREMRTSDEELILHNNLQWLSYIATQSIMRDEAARIEFLNKIGSSKTIRVHLLLGDSVPEDDPFKLTFTTLLSEYLTHISICRPDQASSTPPEIPGDTGRNPNRGSKVEIFEEVFDLSCVELYVPNQIPSTQRNVYISSAHPLTDAPFNYGYNIFKDFFEGNCPEQPINATRKNRVNANTINRGQSVIIARPRFTIINSCTFDEVSGDIDFTLFPFQ